ncbi:MAG: LPS assembly lipoprotein LptE [Defluviicoccus sp.]|nr:LPS assembly lipoprotein LptE [Defluviicoccus sp.]MDE0383955.1 LPS assembly lipoprotein LptE [Defluviicoccus sp.]
MWWRSAAAIAAIAAAAALAGCGFAPLYGEREGVRGMLARVEVETVADRTGQLLRNALLLALPPRRAGEAPSWRLVLTLDETRQRVGVEEHAVATRANLTLAARFVLEDAAGAAKLSGRLESIASYNILPSPYATLAAERNARARATSQLADAVVARLAAWLGGRG